MKDRTMAYYSENDTREFDEIYEEMNCKEASLLFEKGQHTIRREHYSDYEYRAIVDFSLECAPAAEDEEDKESEFMQVLVWRSGDGDE
jgi:hypothetical protein